MAIDRRPETFRGSYAAITLLQTSAKYLGEKVEIAKDPVVESVLCHFAANAIQNGSQIGTGDVLYYIVDHAISNLQKIDQAIHAIDPQSADSLRNQEEEYRSQRDKLLTALHEMEFKNDEDILEFIKRLGGAPNTEDYIRKFPEPIAIIDERSNAFNTKAKNLLTVIEQTQKKNLDRYKKLFTSADEPVRKTVKLPGEIEEILSRSRTTAQTTQDKPRQPT